MKSREIKILEGEDFYIYDDDHLDDSYVDYSWMQVDYTINDRGFVDWSVEIPISIRRLKRIENILNGPEMDLSNKIEHYWPK